MTASLPLLVDILLILALLITAGAALLSRDLFRAVVLFIAFGLLMALAWVRLQAPDVAMAEAAIGAGLAGVLLLKTVVLRDRNLAASSMQFGQAVLCCMVVLAVLVWAVLAMPVPSPHLAESLQAGLPASGVSHAVTAVLLNFRGYDTFLEIVVLTIAALISLALQASWEEPAPVEVSNRLLSALVIWLLPVTLMVAVYLFWAGSREAGGAFQAGALLAAGGVLLRLSGMAAFSPQQGIALHLALSAGLIVFLLAALIGPINGRPLFSYPPAHAGLILVSVEAVLALSIGSILLSLFSPSPPAPEPGHER